MDLASSPRCSRARGSGVPVHGKTAGICRANGLPADSPTSAPAQIGFREAVAVKQSKSVGFQVPNVDLQRTPDSWRSDVHGIAGSGNVVGREVQLEAAYARQRSRQARESPRDSPGKCECHCHTALPYWRIDFGDLHAVAGIAANRITALSITSRFALRPAVA